MLPLTNFPVALSKGSDEYNNLRDKLKGLICNKKPPKVGNMEHHQCQMLVQNTVSVPILGVLPTISGSPPVLWPRKQPKLCTSRGWKGMWDRV